MTSDRSQFLDITVDDREQKSGVLEKLSQIESINICIQRLSLGDYLIDRRVIAERKTLRDFATSIIDGRLFKQAIRLSNANLSAMLILEGTAKDIADTGVTREAMQGALITVSLILGIPVLRAVDAVETAKLLVYCARQVRAMSTSIQRHGYRPKGKRKRQLYILQGLPGVGSERASRLLDTFGSVEGVISASSRDLQAIDGVGPGVADKIRWIVSGY